MSLPMNQLSGFMRVGPQRYAERPNGVQVIQRGPHGMYLAADPVVTREGKQRGSGFRFWVEQLNVPADASWNPTPKVVGLLGLPERKQRVTALQRRAAQLRERADRAKDALRSSRSQSTVGSLGAEPLDIAKRSIRTLVPAIDFLFEVHEKAPQYDYTIPPCPPRPPVPRPGPIPSYQRQERGAGGVLGAGDELHKIMDLFCRGNVKAAKSLLLTFSRKILPAIPQSQRGPWAGHLANVQAWVVRYAQVVQRNLAATEESVSEYQRRVRGWNVGQGAAVARTTRDEIACAKKGPEAYAAWTATGACPDLPSPSGWVRQNWWKAALVAGGIAAGGVLLYSFGRGAAARI